MPRRATAWLLALALLLPGVARAGDTFTYPETRAGEVARAYIESLNSADLEQLRQFNVDYRTEEALARTSSDDRAAKTLGLYEQMGELIPALVTDESESSVTITVHAEKIGMWLSCTFKLEENEPYRLDSVMIQPGSPPEMTVGTDKEWASLGELLEQVCADTKIPAIAAAVIQDGQIAETAAVGVRRAGAADAVQIDDGFHIGSITKSVTATMIGRLVEEGLLDWDTTVKQGLKGMDMLEEYRDVTLEQLLQHRSGLPGYLTFDETEGTRLNSLHGTPTEQREAFVTEVLQSEPIAAAGARMEYSNAGYVVAGLMAEHASGTGWEELVEKYVLNPAGMKHSGFGWPATDARPDQPRGHYHEDSGFRAQGIDEYPLGSFMAPAGDVHASIGDLALYARMHLEGLAGRDGALKASTIKRLHLPPETEAGEPLYAGGWMIMEREGLGPVHAHSGSAGTFVATVELYPEENRAIVVLTNVGAGMGAIEAIIKSINKKSATTAR